MHKKMRDIVATCKLRLPFNDVIDLIELIPAHHVKCRYTRFFVILMAITTIGTYPFINDLDIVLTCLTMGIAGIVLITDILLDFAIYRIESDTISLYVALSTVKDYCEYEEKLDDTSQLHLLFQKYELMNGAKSVRRVVYSTADGVAYRIYKTCERYTLCYTIMKVIAVILFALNTFNLFIA